MMEGPGRPDSTVACYLPLSGGYTGGIIIWILHEAPLCDEHDMLRWTPFFGQMRAPIKVHLQPADLTYPSPFFDPKPAAGAPC